MKALMNDTKWDEIRRAMYELGPSPRWRTKDVHSGYISEWDREWFYHFQQGGYDSIEWVEISTDDDRQHAEVRDALKRIHVPGEEHDRRFVVYGYVADRKPVDWI